MNRVSTFRTAKSIVLLCMVLAGQACATATDQPTGQKTNNTTETTSVIGDSPMSTTQIPSADSEAPPPDPQTVDSKEATYLQETVPPCAPVENSNRDPCTAGAPPNVETGDAISSRPKIHAPPLDTILNYWDLVASLSTHVVLRGTVLPDTTRCGIYEVVTAEYLGESMRRRFEGWTHNFCFIDVRVNEYLLGTGPTDLTVIADLDNPPHPDYPPHGPTLEQRVREAYEDVEGVLFLSAGHSLALEVWEMVFFWDVQEVDGVVRVIAPDRDQYPPTPENLALLDFTLEDFRTKITEAAATRFAHTGGRIGTDPSLPLLIGDANLLSTYYGAIGAVYNDPSQAPATPPPIPGDDEPEGPPANTGEPDSGDDQTPPVPGDDDEQPPNSVP